MTKDMIQFRMRVLQRWRNEPFQDLQFHFYKVQRSFRFFKYNLYILNKAALKIQHWFFERGTKRTVKNSRQNECQVRYENKKSYKKTKEHRRYSQKFSQHQEFSQHNSWEVDDDEDQEIHNQGENHKTQESFVSQSHITSSERNQQQHRQHSQKKMTSNNYGGEPTPRDITPNGVSRHNNRVTDGTSSTATNLFQPPKQYGSNPFQAKPSDPSTLNTNHPQEDQCYFENNESELQKFLDARRSDIQKRERQHLKQNQDDIQSRCQLSVMGYEERVLKTSMSQKSFVTNHTKTSSHSRKPIDRDQACNRVKSKSKRDQSYTTKDGRVHHPKIWGARQCSWKPHELQSLTSLIDQAMKNTLGNKNVAVVSADQHGSRSYTPTSIDAKSNNGYHASNQSSHQRSKSKPRFVTNCDWVKGTQEEQNQAARRNRQSAQADGDSPMGDYFNKERAPTPNMGGTRGILSVSSPVKEAQEDEEEFDDKLRRSGQFSNSSSSMLNFKKSPRRVIKKIGDNQIKLSPYQLSEKQNSYQEEDEFQEEVGNLQVKSQKKKFASNYARQTSWRAGEVQAIQGLIVKAAASKSQKNFRKCPPLSTNLGNLPKSPRAKTPNNVTKIVINPCEAGGQSKCHGQFFSPEVNQKQSKIEPKSAGNIKYQLNPVEINPVVSAKDSRTTPIRDRNCKVNSFIHYPKNSISSSKLSIESGGNYHNTSIQTHQHHNNSMRYGNHPIPPRYQQPTKNMKKSSTAVNRTNDEITSIHSNKRAKNRKYSNVQSKVKQIINGATNPRGSSSCRIQNIKDTAVSARSKTPITSTLHREHCPLPKRSYHSKNKYSNENVNHTHGAIQLNERSSQDIRYKSIIDENSNATQAARKIGDLRNSEKSEQIQLCYNLKKQLQRLDKEYVKQKTSNEEQWISKQLLQIKDKRAPFSEVI